MSRREGEVAFDSDIGKIQAKPESGVAVFDMGVSFGWSNAIPCVIPIFIRR
jgi:hypothetical protein